MYINRGRFGEFVNSVIDAENQRKAESAEKENDWKLWTMYVHSMADESFNDWKRRVLSSASAKQNKTGDETLTEDGIQAILDKLFTA